jgi:hypothetical protein
LFQKNTFVQVLIFDNASEYRVEDFNTLIAGASLAEGFVYAFNGDYDGDCDADLILLSSAVGSTLHFFKGSAQNKYMKAYNIAFEQPITHFAVQDISKIYPM